MSADPREHDEGPERVRVCPDCNEIVNYHVRDCPACGHHDPLLEFPALGAGTRTCADCGAQMLHSLVFCPKCGAERDALPHRPLPEDAEHAADPRDARSMTILAWALALLGPLVMLAALLSVFF